MASVEYLLKLILKYSSFVIYRLCLALTSTSPPMTQKPPMNLFVLIHDVLPHHPQLFPTWGSILFPTLDPGGTRVQGSPGPLFSLYCTEGRPKTAIMP